VSKTKIKFSPHNWDYKVKKKKIALTKPKKARGERREEVSERERERGRRGKNNNYEPSQICGRVFIKLSQQQQQQQQHHHKKEIWGFFFLPISPTTSLNTPSPISLLIYFHNKNQIIISYHHR